MAKRKVPTRKPRAGKPEKGKKPVRKKKAQQQRLLDDMPKNRALDGICKTIAEVREEKNELISSEKGALQNAAVLMQKHQLPTYKAHGVELSLVAGDVKVRARLVDDDSGGEDVEEAERDGEHPDAEKDGDDAGKQEEGE